MQGICVCFEIDFEFYFIGYTLDLVFNYCNAVLDQFIDVDSYFDFGRWTIKNL